MKPDLITAIEDANLFLPYLAGDADGLTSWSRWLTMLRCLYGLPVSTEEHETIRDNTGRDATSLPPGGFSEALLLCGRRSGKSKIIALVAAAEAILSGREKNLSPGEIGMVAVISPTRFQSRIVHEYIRAVFESTPLLANEVTEEKRDAFVLRNGVEINIVTGDPRSARGFTLLSAIIDEIAMFGLTEESKVRSDSELVRAIRPSLATTGGRLLCIGSPYRASGYAYTQWKRSYGHDDSDVLCWNAPSTEMNPLLPVSVVDRALADDPIAARCEYVTERGAFREDVSGYITRAEVEALVVPGRKELSPRSGVTYGAFADVSGGRHDDAAVAIAHMEDRIVIVDCLQRFKAPHNPYEVVAGMVATLRRYGISKATGDAYAAEWTRTAFASHGIDYNRATRSEWKEGAAAITKVAKPKSQLYLELLPRLHSGEIELLDDDLLVTQLSSLQRRTRSGARDGVDHPPGAHDDLANVIAGVTDVVSHRQVTAGADAPSSPHPQHRTTEYSSPLTEVREYERRNGMTGPATSREETAEIFGGSGRSGRVQVDFGPSGNPYYPF